MLGQTRIFEEEKKILSSFKEERIQDLQRVREKPKIVASGGAFLRKRWGDERRPERLVLAQFVDSTQRTVVGHLVHLLKLIF